MGKIKLVPKSQCIYVTCRARNLCVQDHCVGAAMKEQGYIFAENGDIKQIKEAKE